MDTGQESETPESVNLKGCCGRVGREYTCLLLLLPELKMGYVWGRDSQKGLSVLPEAFSRVGRPRPSYTACIRSSIDIEALASILDLREKVP